MNNKPIFIDSNILIYAFDIDGRAKHDKAKEILNKLWEDRTGCISTQVLQEFFVVSTQKIKFPLSIYEAKEIIEDLSEWNLHTIDSLDILSAINIKDTYDISFWDSLIIRAATMTKCEYI